MPIRKVGKNTRREKPQEPKIMGAKPLKEAGEPRVLDQRTRSRPVEIQSKAHEEVVTVSSHTRQRPKKKDDPEIRLRHMTPEDREAWEAVKSNQWEDE